MPCIFHLLGIWNSISLGNRIKKVCFSSPSATEYFPGLEFTFDDGTMVRFYCTKEDFVYHDLTHSIRKSAKLS